MTISIEQVEHIAKLARLGINEEEKQLFAGQISSILDYIEQLKEVDTTKVEPTAQVTGLENVYRSDEVIDSAKIRDGLLKQAPSTENDLIKTLGVFE